MPLLFLLIYIWHFSLSNFLSQQFNENKVQRSVTAHYVSSRLAKPYLTYWTFVTHYKDDIFKQWKYETNWVIFKMTKRNLLKLILMSHLQCESHQIFDRVFQITQSPYIFWHLVGSTAPVLWDWLFCHFSSLVIVTNISKYVSQIYATLGIGSELWILSAYTSWNGICAQKFSLCISTLFWKWPLSCYLLSLSGRDTSK